MPKNRRRLSQDKEKLDKARLIALIISGIGPVAQLLDAISRIVRLQTRGPLPGDSKALLAGGHVPIRS